MYESLDFVDEPMAEEIDPNRADIACFVGLVARRAAPVSQELRGWLAARGWGRERPAALDDLRDVPVPVASWAAFDALFAWDRRPLDAAGRVGATYLGAAVRSFFAQGGRLCYVVRAGDPPALDAAREDRAAQVASLLPGYPWRFDASSADPESWRGAGALSALDDAAMICLPDLCDLLAPRRPAPPTDRDSGRLPEQFVECGAGEPPDPEDRAAGLAAAPRLDGPGLGGWARAINLLASFVARRRRDVQVLAALPLLEAGLAAAKDPLAQLGAAGPLGQALDEGREGVASAFVQLAYPWVAAGAAPGLPEGLEPPDGLLAGLIARGAIERGAFRSVAGSAIAGVAAARPALSRAAIERRRADRTGGSASHSLAERVSLIAPGPQGWQLRTDVTSSLDESYRPAAVCRLVACIVRAARRIGEDSLFESSGELAWARVRRSMEARLRRLLEAGALRGERAAAAFSVRCDRSTMTQNDIDSGRMVVSVTLSPAAPIERITVVLALSAGRQPVVLEA